MNNIISNFENKTLDTTINSNSNDYCTDFSLPSQIETQEETLDDTSNDFSVSFDLDGETIKEQEQEEEEEEREIFNINPIDTPIEEEIKEDTPIESSSINESNPIDTLDPSEVSLLTAEETLKLPEIKKKREETKIILKNIIRRQDSPIDGFSQNGIVIDGAAGIGKTTLVLEALDELLDDEEILDYKSFNGKCSSGGVIDALSESQTATYSSKWNRPIYRVLVFDDVDIFNDTNTLNALKAAFEIRKSSAKNTTRPIHIKKARQDDTIYFKGIGIFVYNAVSTKSPHFLAFKNRLVSQNLDFTPEELKIYMKSIAEGKMKATNISNKTRFRMMSFYKRYIERWLDLDIYRNPNLSEPFSLRSFEELKNIMIGRPNSTNEEILKSVRFFVELETLALAKEIKIAKDKEKAIETNTEGTETESTSISINTPIDNEDPLNKLSEKDRQTLKEVEEFYAKYKNTKKDSLTIEEMREYKKMSQRKFLIMKKLKNNN